MEQNKFESWALVELFGHTKIAGKVSEQQIAGGSMLRIDVPETKGNPPFTRLIGLSAIYAINPIDQETAAYLADSLQVKPIDVWDIRDFLQKTQKSLKAGEDDGEN